MARVLGEFPQFFFANAPKIYIQVHKTQHCDSEHGQSQNSTFIIKVAVEYSNTNVQYLKTTAFWGMAP
jgi:hypothetical protein